MAPLLGESSWKGGNAASSDGRAVPLGQTIGRRALRRLREVRRELRTLGDGEASFFDALLPELGELLGTEAVSAYGLRQATGAAYELSFHHFAGKALAPDFSRLFARFLASDAPVSWGAYNPGRPERAQRNRVFTATWGELQRFPIATSLFPAIGVGGKTQFRVLLCDGPSLLGWVGAWHDGDCDVRQQAILGALVPALRRRLKAERQLVHGARLAAFDIVLDAVATPAFLVDARGRIREANCLGRDTLAREGRTVRDELLAAVGFPHAHPRWTTTEIRGGNGVDFLVVGRSRAPGGRLGEQVARASARWSLTPRQTEILARIAEGNANRTIAAMTAISERTVEVHVTALLDKAQVESRAELIAKTYLLES